MSMFINQMLGCLIIAAGIGGAVGWLLRNVSAGKLTQQLADVTTMMHLKEQMLEKARYELRDAASKLQAVESQMMASQPLNQSDQEELAAAKLQLSAWESGGTRLLKLIRDSEAETIAQTEDAAQSKTPLEAAYPQAVEEQIGKAA
jgi:hypothetical protein